MSLVQFFRILWARRGVILLTTLATMIAAVIVGKLVPPRYEASSRATVDALRPDPVSGVAVAGTALRPFYASQTELIKDYAFVGKVVDDLGWANSPDLAEEYQSSGAADRIDFRRWLAERIISNLEPEFVQGSEILAIKYTATSPQAAAAVADAVRKAYIDETLRRKRDNAVRTAAFFRRQTDDIGQRIADLEKRKTEFERANNIYVDDEQVDADTRRLQAIAASSDPIVTGIASGPVVAPADPSAAQLAQIDAAIESAARVYGPNHPELQRLREQRTAVAASARASAPRVIAAPRAVAGPSVEAQYRRQQSKVFANRAAVDQARKMGADITVLREQYAKSSARAAELEQQGASEEAGVTPLGNAVIPQTAVWPKWPLLLGGSLFLGFALGTLTAMLMEMLGMRVRGIEDLRIDGVPVLGAMGGRAAPPRRWPWQRRLADGVEA